MTAVAAEPGIAISEPTAKVRIKEREKRVSGLSISSLKAKKAHEENKREEVIDPEQLPRETIGEEDMQKHWTQFVRRLEKEGKKILASNLSTDVPKLEEAEVIAIELPNGTMKKEIEREKGGLLQYLKENLQNHFIRLKITVNEESAKKFAYTPEEKYEKLREKNPAIDILRKEFDLDL